MRISTEITLNEEDEQELSNILDCEANELSSRLSPYASASIEELISMFLGQKVFNRGTDILEYRLYLLILYAFDGRIPDEQEVCRLFQTTQSSSRSLIRAVMSKYQYQLKTAIETTIKTLLQNVEVNNSENTFIVSVHNRNLVEELNKELAEIDTNLPPVSKKRGSVSTFELKPSSYNRLCNRFGIDPIQIDD